jgi:hypothetical protein
VRGNPRVQHKLDANGFLASDGGNVG